MFWILGSVLSLRATVPYYYNSNQVRVRVYDFFRGVVQFSSILDYSKSEVKITPTAKAK